MDDDPSAARQAHRPAEEGEQPGEYQALIRALLRQIPEERLLGLRRAATFFGGAQRQ